MFYRQLCKHFNATRELCHVVVGDSRHGNAHAPEAIKNVIRDWNRKTVKCLIPWLGLLTMIPVILSLRNRPRESTSLAICKNRKRLKSHKYDTSNRKCRLYLPYLCTWYSSWMFTGCWVSLNFALIWIWKLIGPKRNYRPWLWYRLSTCACLRLKS